MTQTATSSGLSAAAEEPRGRKLNRKQLINRLNAINFRDGEILVCLRHNRFGNTVIHQARPQPCAGEELECLWVQPGSLPERLENYTCVNFQVNDGQRSYIVTPKILALTADRIRFLLPQTCNETAERRFRRHNGSDVAVQFIQNGSCFHGSLVDFSPASLRLNLEFTGHQSARWLNPQQSAEVVLNRGNEMLFSGSCNVVRELSRGPNMHTLVVAPERSIVSRYRPKEYRSTRQKLLPTPTATFRHPLSGKRIDISVADISGTGFSLVEEESESMLIPGMLIPEIRLGFSGNFFISCIAQVVYRLPDADSENRVRCGITFLDMPPDDHVQLLALLHRAEDEQASYNQEIDPDKLWDFFFESGFLYPEKYASVASDIEEFKKTYRKLYSSYSTITRHFIHQSHGRIVAHMAALRFYNNAWMLHHHAATSSFSAKAGLNVLNQTGRWANDTRSIKSGHFDYFFCYFQEKNRFPNRVFGGLAESIDNRSICSIDRFAYYHHNPSKESDWDLCQPWSLTRAEDEDIREFGFYYQSVSGGLLPEAQDLLPETYDCEEIGEEFSRHGFRRERSLYALRENGVMRAFIAVHVADIGLNMSDLTSAVQVFVLDPDNVPRSVIELILSLLCCKTGRRKAPVLLYPESYARQNGIESEKTYSLLVFNTEYFDYYFRHLQALIRHINH